MGKIILVTGGARSGKSKFAEDLLEGEKRVLYVATGVAFDDEMQRRIDLHQKRRDKSWQLLESYKELALQLVNYKTSCDHILLDCLSLLVSNLMFGEYDYDWDTLDAQLYSLIEEKIQTEVSSLLEFLKEYSGDAVLVTNELGMGIVPATRLGRYFRDIAGRVNQLVAKEADQVFLLVSGISLQIK